MLQKIKKFIFILLILNMFYLPVSSQVLDLSSAKSNTSFQLPRVEVYKPSRLISGGITEFTVKGEPNTHVVLVFSGENQGAKPFYGQELRLGVFVHKVEGKIDENGIGRLGVELPKRDDLIGKPIYFEALTWTREDLSDLSKARIIGTNGRETAYNVVVIANKPEKNLMPMIGPGMGNMGNMSRTMEALSDQEIEDKEYLYTDDVYYQSKPLILRNLRAPESRQEQK